MRISDWSSDVCSSDLDKCMTRRSDLGREAAVCLFVTPGLTRGSAFFLSPRLVKAAGFRIKSGVTGSAISRHSEFVRAALAFGFGVDRRGQGIGEIGRASCRARVCQYV